MARFDPYRRPRASSAARKRLDRHDVCGDCLKRPRKARWRVATPATPYDLRDTFASSALHAGVTVFELARVNSLYDYLRRNNGTGPGWEWKGHVSKWSAGGAGKWSYTVGTQGHYAACSVVTGCVVHDYPWLQLKVYDNGSWARSSGTG